MTDFRELHGIDDPERLAAAKDVEEAMDTDFDGVNKPHTIVSSVPRKENIIQGTHSNLYPESQAPHGAGFGGTVVTEHSPLAQGGARKRGHKCEEGEGEVVEKRGCEEGMSWWTCLMLGMDQQNTRPQIVRKSHTSTTTSTTDLAS